MEFLKTKCPAKVIQLEQSDNASGSLCHQSMKTKFESSLFLYFYLLNPCKNLLFLELYKHP